MTSVRNLCFHYVLPDPARGTRRLALSVGELRAAIERELAQGRAPASLDAYVGPRAPTSAFTVSFDDAHRSVLELAAPLLAQMAIPATLFVPTAWVGSGEEWLSWAELRRLRDEFGFTLGSHTVTHPRMSLRHYRGGEPEDDAAFVERLRDECARSRREMEEQLAHAPRLFAYPYGEAPPQAREAVREAGYAAAFTVSPSTDWDGDPLGIPRLEALEACGLVEVQAGPKTISVVVPARDRVPILGEMLGRLAAQSYPDELYEVIVVDDGSLADLAPVVQAACPGARLLRAAEPTDPFRAGRARQRGADEAKHEIVCFLDADVVVGEDYLWALDWVHRRNPRALLLGYLSGYNLHDLGMLHTVGEVSGAELSSTPIIHDRQREPVLRACLDNVDWLPNAYSLCYTGNLSLPRSLLREVGGFADEFSGWGLEDVDLGFRLQRAGASFVVGRFALGYHLVDPSEEAPRNPFRRASPTREDFAGYLENLLTLERRHAGDPEIARFAERSRADVDETCSRPQTVGIELGGHAELRPSFHARLHRMQPGGVPEAELLDRVAYAAKVGARRLWLQGGEPADHRSFLEVLAHARELGLSCGVRTMAHAFAHEGLAQRACALGMDHATVLVLGGNAERHEAHCGPGSWARFALGVEALALAGVHRSAEIVVTRHDVDAALECATRLRSSGVEVECMLALDQDAAEALAARAPEIEVRRVE